MRDYDDRRLTEEDGRRFAKGVVDFFARPLLGLTVAGVIFIILLLVVLFLRGELPPRD